LPAPVSTWARIDIYCSNAGNRDRRGPGRAGRGLQQSWEVNLMAPRAGLA